MSLEKFSTRHLGPRETDVKEMLSEIGVRSMDELIKKTIPNNILLSKEIDLEEGISEREFLDKAKAIASKNIVASSYIGLGFYPTIVPSVVLRNIFENPGWYTAYTPYQAEIAQGRLEALLNFQTVVSDLTGMEIANASLLDEATAGAEAMIMFYNTRKRAKIKAGAKKFFVSEEIFPQTMDVLYTRAEPLEIEIVVGNHQEFKFTEDYFGALVQYPSGDGQIYDYSDFIENAHQSEAFVAVAADLMSLVLLTPPGEWGADVTFGTTQRFGVPMGFGGPHAAYFATHEKYKRNIPGRIIGISKDRMGNQGYRMALQTREQHIRREKATSNICTAQALLAIMSSMYAVYHGAEGLQQIASHIHENTVALATELEKAGFKNQNSLFFDTIKIAVSDKENIRQKAESKNINFRYFEDNYIGISLHEKVTEKEVKDIIEIISGASVNSPLILKESLGNFKRKSEFLTHEIFHKYRSETEMMRYIKRLENKDLSLVHAMIPLGSCTMKLNAATELIPVTWPEFSAIHPLAPNYQVKGYLELMEDFEKDLSVITGFAGATVQPNSGAQGEYTGLLVIRAYHQSRGEHHRNVCLIPSSAHGTNPASAVMAGMKVVIVKCDKNGNVDLTDLKEKAEQNKENLSAFMITYPSTHGVFEESIVEINDIIHSNGGQVYMDGANMNAQVGLTNPGQIGADVCHLNLHKTFAIPHGGGGPGVGPIAVAKHLVPFLPGNILKEPKSEQAIRAVSSSLYGSASIVLISYAYIKMLGKSGLKQATEYAILNANYIKSKLEKEYKILYTGKNGTVAHEMILDCRDFKHECGIEVEDMAKRLMDYGFHAPTVSFPVASTLMIEPTESESKEELDRFCEAMTQIKQEINDVASGKLDLEDNVLKMAPHTANELTSDNWEHLYSRKQAAYPLPYVQERKFWPAINRIDNAFGDRNLVCTCPNTEEYAQETVG